jgi:hypothetical protein
MIRTYENFLQPEHDSIEGTGARIPERELTVSGPFYSRICARGNYTGIDKLGITFSNNVSFAKAEGTDLSKDDTTHFQTKLYADASELGPTYGSDGMVSGALLGKDQTESWLSLYNALGVTYKITGMMTGFFNYAQRLAWFTMEFMGADTDPNSSGELNKQDTRIYKRTDLMGVLGVTFALPANATFHAGASLRYLSDSFTYEGDYHEQLQVRTPDRSYGTLTFAVPLWLRVRF